MPESALERRGFMARWKLNPHRSYTGAMSYEHEPAGAIWQSVTPSTVAPASFSDLPASLSRLAAKSLFRRSWRHCYLCGRYFGLTLLGPVS